MRSVLEFPWAYNLMQVLSGWHGEGQRRFVSEVVRPSAGDRVLDVGCGTAAILSRLGEVEYTGMDMNGRYIAHARRRRGNAGRFLCADVNEFDFSSEQKFDLILMMGLVHHLKDADASRLLMQARDLLVPSGRLVTMDACRTDGQGRFERWMVEKDRGHYIRPVQAYLDLAKLIFPGVTSHTRKDLVRFTYTFLVMECSLGEAAELASQRSDAEASEIG
jgi:SAM-dependent methyltransferase